MDLHILLIVIFFGFLAAFIDAVVGGGGLISIPALLATGMNPAVALGTNKLASSFGSLTSTVSFIRSGKVDFHIVGRLFPVSFILSILGALTATYLPPALLKPIVIIMLTLVLIYTLFNKDWGSTTTYKKLSPVKSVLFIVVVAFIGFYDGFLGGGTGSFLLFSLLLIGFDFLRAAGNAKFLNFASNLGAVLLFIYLGKVDYVVGLAMGLSMVAGSFAGSQFALNKGVSYVKLLFIIVTVLLISKNAWDYITAHFFH
ncbi:sulfite exporter TauE/SafE family protein [Macrococcus equipercicus]|uniref:Probable membrane transporter protein n=1 Tax=Macrococcus equipercicus TaxID=69967 RepID=A0A9Q9BL42_9STAP|nr:TSUP family transporter [Macrococcus equipercicus]KAA1038438.1 TSUP family transporter [Macrococcus equipercicus]UTH13175.1 TSUP family transporter [Macrococcus equipercicus]